MAITLNTLGNAASIAANFLAAPETKLVQQLQTVFVDAEITDVEVRAQQLVLGINFPVGSENSLGYGQGVNSCDKA